MILSIALFTPLLLQSSAPAAVPGAPTLTCHLESRGGTRILFLDGTVEERGFGEGYLLADDILSCFTNYALEEICGDRVEIWDMLARPGVLLRFSIDDETREWAEALVDGMEAAKGGAVRVEALDRDLEALDVLVWSTLPDLAGFACSSLAVWGEARAGESGDVLVGRNLDYSSTPEMARLSLIEVHAPMEATDDSGAKAGWVGVTWPGAFGCLTGLSEHGVFVAIHDVYMQAPRLGRKCTPRTLALSRVMETAVAGAGLGQRVTEELEDLTFATGGNFMLAWQGDDSEDEAKFDSRGAAIIEVATQGQGAASAVLRGPLEGETAVACSNDHYAREGDEPGCDRYQGLIGGSRDEEAGLDADGMWELVEDAGMSICLYRCVADLGQGELDVQRYLGDRWGKRVVLDVGELLGR